MKKLLIGLVLSVAVSAPAFADDVTEHEKMELCVMAEELATTYMESRQLGVPMARSLAIAGDNEFSKRIVLDAYSQPAMRTPENALRQRTEFGVKWALECIKNT